MNKNIICWFEIYVDDIDRAKKFYSKVLNIQFSDAHTIEDSGDYKMSFFSDPENQGVNGALVQTEDSRSINKAHNSTMVYFPCEDCSIEEAKVENAGGKIISPKMNLGEFGFCTICLDSEGNTFGLHSMK